MTYKAVDYQFHKYMAKKQAADLRLKGQLVEKQIREAQALEGAPSAQDIDADSG